uniref:GT23 domain-containing protein n=1 Tax=Meloidogyne hapla TaxID=6305 RepID=A0A1I8BVY6_MELHA
MQTYGTDASNNVHSLDYFYSEHSHSKKFLQIFYFLIDYFYYVLPFLDIRMVAITDYIQEKEVTSPIDNEGYVLGRKSLVDLLQGQTKIPIYLLKYHSNFVNFTTFMNIELK